MTRVTGLMCFLLAALSFAFGAQSACGTGGFLVKQPVSNMEYSIVRALQAFPSDCDGGLVPKKIPNPNPGKHFRLSSDIEGLADCSAVHALKKLNGATELNGTFVSNL